MSERVFLVGLGNPGSEYALTRHNVGFLLVDRIAEKFSGAAGANWKQKFSADYLDVTIAGLRVTLVKPQSFMNRSGEPLQQLMSFFKVPVEDIVVAHDEVDIPFGAIRLKSGGGEAGHNGLRSISSRVGTKQYLRLRLGVDRPTKLSAANGGQSQDDAPRRSDGRGSDGKGSDGKRSGGKPELSSWVLGRFSNEEQRELDMFLDRATDAYVHYLEHGLKEAQNQFH